MERITATAISFALLLIGSWALPSSPQQNHVRGSVRAKLSTSSTSSSVTTMPLVVTGFSTLPPSTFPPTQSSTLRSPATASTAYQTGSSTTMTSATSVTATTTTPTTKTSAKTAATTTVATPTPTSTPLALTDGYVTTSSTVLAEKTSSRTISTTGGSVDFSSPTRKPIKMNEDTTSAVPSTSAKETRESPGKIRPQIKITTNYTSASETGVRLPEGASAALAKPTKYHYYPHNQHIYLLPECAVQQVCNAVYVRLNFTQPLCACPGRYRDPCSASLDSDDLHTTELVTDPRTKALTLVKTCEPVAEMRECRAPRDWSLLALQNVRTGKSHYLVICRCPDTNILEGPMSHDQPTYASVPGIRVYGMMCVQGNRRGRPLRHARSLNEVVPTHALDFPWKLVPRLMSTARWD